MGFQFFHLESYARKAGKGKAGGHTVGSVIAEAIREPDACPHVETPQPPVLIFGCPAAEVEAKAVEWAESSRDSIGRKLRADGLCLLSGVVSAPDDMSPDAWEGMKRDTVEWLNRDGRLVSVIEHTDESHRHIHFYKVPAPGARFETLHPGRAAALEAKAAGAVKGDQNQAYKEAMRGLQDDFFASVGARHGLTRLGPAKRRLTRSEWHSEQTAALAASVTMAKADKMMLDAASAVGLVVEMSTAVDAAKASADAAKAAAVAIAEQAKADADRAEAAAARAATTQKANALAVVRWSKQKATIDLVAAKTKTDRAAARADRAAVEAWASRGGRLGAFVGNLAGRAADAVVGIFSGRAAKEEAAAARLVKAERVAAAAKLRAEEETTRANRKEWEKSAEAESHRKEIRRVEAEKSQIQKKLAELSGPVPGLAQGVKRGPRIGQ